MATTYGTPSVMRLHGEDGKVFVVDHRGNKLWRVEATGIDVSEGANAIATLSINGYGFTHTES